MFTDLDTPNSTIAHSLGPVTRYMARIIGALTGGHRNGTHSLLWALLATLLTAWGLAELDDAWLKIGLCVFFISLAVRALTEVDGPICFALSAILGATAASVAPGSEWLIAAVGLGCLLHMLGDALTPEGVPALMPFSDRRFSLPVIGATGDTREKLIAGLCGLGCCWLLATTVFAPMWASDSSTAQARELRGSERRAAPATSSKRTERRTPAATRAPARSKAATCRRLRRELRHSARSDARVRRALTRACGPAERRAPRRPAHA